MGISETTFYNRQKKFGGVGVTELRRLLQLEEENHRLKRLVADLSLDNEMGRTSFEKSSGAGAETRGGRIPAGGVPHRG